MSRKILVHLLPFCKHHFIPLPVSLATHLVSQMNVECHLQFPVVTFSLHSYCLESAVLQVLPHGSCILHLGNGEGVTSTMELKKWHLKLYCLCHYLVVYLQFSLLFFNTVSLAMSKISATNLVAAKGFKTYCFSDDEQ